MNRRTSLLGAAALLAGCFTSAHAAPSGRLTCMAESKQIQVNIGFFEFGAIQTPATLATPAASSNTLLHVHAALSQFAPFYQAANRKIQTCDLSVTMPDGGVAEFTFQGLTLDSVTAVARAPRLATDAPARYADIQFHYSSMKVVSSGGNDDGGVDGGWYTPVGTGPVNGGGSQ